MAQTFIGSINDGRQFTAEELDEKRQNRSAYDYLCRLYEVRNWLEDCLGENAAVVPPAIDLESNLRNGVLLAQLARHFAPNTVDLRTERIFDEDQAKYEAQGPVYRHTDNIMIWRRAMISVRIPAIIIPETVDIYEGRNIRTIFCLYEIAMRLFRVRRGPPIRNLTGARFSPQEIEQIAERLQAEAVSVLAFTEGDGMIGKDRRTTPITTATVIELIDEAITRQDAGVLVNELVSGEANFECVEFSSARDYLAAMVAAREAAGRPLNGSEIQAAINNVNAVRLLANLETYLTSQPEEGETDEDRHKQLSRILMAIDPERTLQVALKLYDRSLRDCRERQDQALTTEQVVETLNLCNACVQVEISVRQGNSDDLYRSLQDPSLNLEGFLREDYKEEYYTAFLTLFSEDLTEVVVDVRKIMGVIAKLNSTPADVVIVKKISQAVDQDDVEGLDSLLRQLDLPVQDGISGLYLEEIKATDPQPASREEFEGIVNRVNARVAKAVVEARQTLELNNSLVKNDAANTKKVLEASTWRRAGKVRSPVLSWYVPTLKDDLAQKKARFNAPESEQVTSIDEPLSSGQLIRVSADNAAEGEKVSVVSAAENPNPQAWPLTTAEIDEILVRVNESFDAYYREAEDKIRTGQKHIRDFLNRKRRIAELERREKELKLQQEFYIQELQGSTNPSFECVTCVIQTVKAQDVDQEEENQVEQLRSKITHLVRANQTLESDLAELDTKIGLLIKNRINIQDVIDHTEKIEADKEAFEKRQPSLRRGPSKLSWRPLEVLCFHLQVEPTYLANLFETEGVELTELSREIVFPLFHYGSEERERGLLLRVYTEVLSRYVHDLTQPQDFLASGVRSHRLVSAMTIFFDSLAGSLPTSAVIASDLKKTFEEFQSSESKVKVFNLMPKEVFEDIHERSPDSIADALTDEGVATVVEESKAFLLTWSQRFVNDIIKSVTIPSQIVRLLKACAIHLRQRFPDIKQAEIDRALAKFLFQTFVRRALTDIRYVQQETGKTMTPRQNDILKSIAKLLSYAVAGNGFDDDSEPHMVSLNDELRQINNLFTSFTSKHLMAGNTPVEEEVSGFYSIFADSSKPQLHIQVKHVKALLVYLKNYKAVVIPEETSKLRALVDQARVPEDTETVVLWLRPLKVEQFEGAELFTETKELLIELLLAGCSAYDISGLLSSKATPEQEAELRKRGSNETVDEKKAQIAQNLVKLEDLSLVKKEDGYQALVNSIARDVASSGRYRAKRRERLTNLRTTANQLEAKREELDGRLGQYQLYLDNVLDNISITARRPSILIEKKSGKAVKRMANKRSGKDKTITVKTNGEKLVKKGIIILDDNKDTKKEIFKTSIELTTQPEARGQIDVLIKYGKNRLTTTHFKFHDILKAADANNELLALDENIRIRPSSLIDYVNRKFYQKS